jgi:uncharacterized protein
MDKKFRAEIFEDENGDWRWRLISSNGRIVEDSSEGYKNKSECYERLYEVTSIQAGNLVTEELE